MPKSIVFDRDPTFTNTFLRELFLLHGTYLNFSSAYHPQFDVQTEVLSKALKGYRRLYTGDNPKVWSLWISMAKWFYNTSCHSLTGLCPFKALYGYFPHKLFF